jgi:hypothetical protein
VIGGGGINFITGGAGGDTFVLDQANGGAYSVINPNYGSAWIFWRFSEMDGLPGL